MLAKVKTATLVGIEGSPVTVEADSRAGLPALNIVGLADTTIRESCGRIKPAIVNSGFGFPSGRVTVNLVPAGKHKRGSHFDLPIAIGVMALETGRGGDAEDGFQRLRETAFLGELSLDGAVNRITGALPLAMSLRSAGIKKIMLPADNAAEVSILRDVELLPVTDLGQAAEHIFGTQRLAAYNICREKNENVKTSAMDFSQVRGQEAAKRAVTICAAGNHGLLMMGGPGCGKTMIARRIPGILPELTYEEKLEITGIYSVAGLLGGGEPIIEERPFRSPHHTVSVATLLGGGTRPRPGEISLAHRGVLFLDELGEFDAGTIDALRQPLEEGQVRIIRGTEEAVFPADVMLIAAANPCKCGNLWDERKLCTCTGRQLDNYRRRLSGPFSDRIDMHLRMSPVRREEITGAAGERSLCTAEMKAMVESAVAVQRERYSGTRYKSNGGLDEAGIETFCKATDAADRLLVAAYEKMGLTMRAYGRLRKVARTIADLDGAAEIGEEHMAEALMYRISDPDQKGE